MTDADPATDADPPAADDTGPPHTATLVFEYPDAESARLVARSVEREAGDIEGDRTRAAVSSDGALVEVRVAADDLVALRAGINTWCTLVEVAERAGAVAGERAPGE